MSGSIVWRSLGWLVQSTASQDETLAEQPIAAASEAATRSSLPRRLLQSGSKVIAMTEQYINRIDTSLASLVPARGAFCAALFRMQKTLLQQRIINGYYQAGNGWTIPLFDKTYDMSEPAHALNSIMDYCQEKGIASVFVMPMSKVIKGYTVLPHGVMDTTNETMDDLLSQLTGDCIDLRMRLDSFAFPAEKVSSISCEVYVRSERT